LWRVLVLAKKEEPVSLSLPSGLAGILPRRAEKIVSRTLGSRLVLYHPDTREVSVLNATAAAVWELCDGRTLLADVVTRLQARFRIEEARDVTADVTAELRTFAERGLISAPVPERMEEALG
jgi:hypothetical protein